jgi:hypothetical protein
MTQAADSDSGMTANMNDIARSPIARSETPQYLDARLVIDA